MKLQEVLRLFRVLERVAFYRTSVGAVGREVGHCDDVEGIKGSSEECCAWFEDSKLSVPGVAFG